jgi:hypothetical protein
MSLKCNVQTRTMNKKWVSEKNSKIAASKVSNTYLKAFLIYFGCVFSVCACAKLISHQELFVMKNLS